MPIVRITGLERDHPDGGLRYARQNRATEERYIITFELLTFGSARPECSRQTTATPLHHPTRATRENCRLCRVEPNAGTPFRRKLTRRLAVLTPADFGASALERGGPNRDLTPTPRRPSQT